MNRRRKIVVLLAVILLLSAAGIVALAAYFLRPAALRAELATALQSAGLRIDRLDEISMGFGGRVRIRGLRIAQPLDPAPNLPPFPPLLEARDVDVDVSVSELIRGHVQIQSLKLKEPVIAVVVQPNVDADLVPQSASRSLLQKFSQLNARDLHLPAIHLTRADVQLLSIHDGDLTSVRRWLVDGACGTTVPRAGDTAGLELWLSQVGGPRAGRDSGENLFRADLRSRELDVSCGEIELRVLKSIIPPAYLGLLSELGGSGTVRLNRASFQDGVLTRLELSASDLTGSVPVEDRTAIRSAEERFLQFRLKSVDVSLTRNVDLAPKSFKAEIKGNGTLNSAAMQLSLSIGDLQEFAGIEMPADFYRVSERWIARAIETSCVLDGFEIPAVGERATFFQSKVLPETLRAFFVDYQPAGKANLRLTWKSWESGLSGVFQPTGMRCRYFRFPYAFEDVHGQVVFSSSGILLDGLHGKHGNTRVRGDGTLMNSHRWTGFDLQFVGENLAFDRDLYAALPPEYQRLWRNAEPLGLSDAHISITRQDASTLPQPFLPSIRIDARLRAGSVAVGDGERLRSVDAAILIEGDKLTVNDMGGYWRGAPVRVNGVVEPPDAEGRERQDLRVEGAGVAIERSGSVFDERGTDLGTIRFEGIANLWGQISARDGENHETYVAEITDGRIYGFDKSEPWMAARGWVNAGETEQEILELRATRGRGQLVVSGKLPMKFPSPGPVKMELTADDLEIERLLSALIPDKWGAIRAALGLSGAGRIQAKFHPSDDGKKQIIDIELLADRMKPGPLPLALTDIAARLTLDADGLVIHECRALYQNKDPIRLSGRVGWDARDGWARLAVEAPSIELTTEFVDALPKALGDLIRRMTARGRITLAFDPLELVSVERQEWSMAGTLRIQEGSLRLGIALQEIAGQLSGSCKIDAAGNVILAADVALDSATLDGRPVRNCLGRIATDPADARIHIEDVKGRTCGGSMMGFTNIDPRSGEYDLSLTVADVALGEFLKDDPSGREKPRPGRLDGRIFLRGRGDDPATRQGGGEFRIRGASLLSSPITRPIAEQGRKRPSTPDIERADLRFAWEADLMRFNHIDLVSKDLRLIGTGTWGMRDDHISMTLAGAAGEDAPRLAILSDLLDSASQELMQYRVEGTVERPRVTVEPLHNLTDPLRKLLKGG